MSLVKRTYVDGQTVITAQNLNAIQDEIIADGQKITALQNACVKEITAEEFAASGYTYIAFYVTTLSDGLYSYRPDSTKDFFFIKSSIGDVATVYECNSTDNNDSSFRIIMGYGSNVQQVAYFGGDGISYGDSANRQTVASTAYVDAAIGGAIGGAY